MTNLTKLIEAETENRAKTIRACENGIGSFAGAKFESVAADRAAYYRAKAASVKGEAARAKWTALAEVWE